jgi:hypothetical protein
LLILFDALRVQEGHNLSNVGLHGPLTAFHYRSLTK